MINALCHAPTGPLVSVRMIQFPGERSDRIHPTSHLTQGLDPSWPFSRELAILAGTGGPFSTELAWLRGTWDHGHIYIIIVAVIGTMSVSQISHAS